MKEQFGLSDKTIDILQRTFFKYKDIDEVLLYGSRAKGTHEKFSDIDITLIGENLSKQTFSTILFDIDDLLLPYMFDISIFHKITNPDVVDHISRVGKVLYNKYQYFNQEKEIRE